MEFVCSSQFAWLTKVRRIIAAAAVSDGGLAGNSTCDTRFPLGPGWRYHNLLLCAGAERAGNMNENTQATSDVPLAPSLGCHSLSSVMTPRSSFVKNFCA